MARDVTVASKLITFAPNGTNLGLFKILFQYILALEAAPPKNCGRDFWQFLGKWQFFAFWQLFAIFSDLFCNFVQFLIFFSAYH